MNSKLSPYGYDDYISASTIMEALPLMIGEDYEIARGVLKSFAEKAKAEKETKKDSLER